MSAVLQSVMPEHGLFSRYSQLRVHYEPAQRALWYAMAPQPKPCFSLTLLGELKHLNDLIRHSMEKKPATSIWGEMKYLVGTSTAPGIFSMGGDLALFRNAIIDRDVEGLRHYAHLCIELLHSNSIDLNRNLTTISLVRGNAVGGGMEMALSSTVVIAERSTEMGLPETLFGLFPGMGAYQLLARRIGITQAEAMILSGKMYNSEELHNMGLIDVLVEDGDGEYAVAEYISRQDAAYRSHRAIHQMRRMQQPIRHDDLLAIAELWIDAAMSLSDRQLRLMQRLAKSQEKLLTRQQVQKATPHIANEHHVCIEEALRTG